MTASNGKTLRQILVLIMSHADGINMIIRDILIDKKE